LLTLRKEIVSKGGFDYVMSYGLFKEIVQNLAESYKTPFFNDVENTSRIYFKLCREMLYSYDLYETGVLSAPQQIDIGYP
jgi:hypothetical protein